MNSIDLYYVEKKLTNIIKLKQQRALDIYNEIWIMNGVAEGNRSFQSMHAIIGSKNNTFVDSIRTQFLDPKDFIQQWIKGLLDIYEDYTYRGKDGKEHKYILIPLLQNEFFREYAFTFLERNFYRNLRARTRYKPDEALWELWFGNGGFVLGILMTPVYRHGKWTNDVSEIRRANYQYWTVGHVMKTGIVDPDATERIIFRSHEDLFTFYRSILKKHSNSLYEKEIFDRYISYLSQSTNIDDEPLLIPEIRYAGLDKHHLHRLDFTILNSHTQEYIGFELSPCSSHMSISGIKSGKTQKDMNKELSEKWNKEMAKRNDYFSEFGITTITFTDKNPENMDDVFSKIELYLKKRDPHKSTISNEIDRLMRL